VFAKRQPRKSLQSIVRATTAEVNRRGRTRDIESGFRKLDV